MKHLIFVLPLIAAAQTAPDGVILDRDVVYSQGNRLMMDIARPAATGLHPAVIALRGTYVTSDRKALAETLGTLARAGYVAGAIDYRVAPRTQFPAPVQDAKTAIRFLRANAAKYSIDPERVAIIGYGDAGLLALLTALTPAVPDFEMGPNREQSSRVRRVIEVDRDRKVVWKYESDDLAGMRSRNVRRTPADTFLISVEAAGKIIEVNRAGEIIWSYTGEGGPKRRPYKGVRLPNGNTLISLNDPGELVEVNPAGKVVRAVGGEKNDIRMIWASGFDVMHNGNILLSDYQGHRVVELNPAGKVVNEVRFPTRSTASIAFVQ